MKSVFDIEKPRAWGGSVLRQTACSKTVIENAIYLPMSSTIFFDIDPGWGIYDEEGDLVDGAAYERSPQRDLVGQSRHIDLSAITIEDSAVDEMIYCGPVIPHYGHFILSSLARLWAFDGTVPALFHSQPSLFEHETPFIQKYIAAAGLSRANAMSFSKPTRIRRLIVPEASLVEQDCVAKEYAVTGRKIGAALHGPADFVDRKFYLSKANLAGGVTGLEDEIVIERAFAEAGFEIIYPERLSVEEQVALFRDASMIVGYAGSGFHTVALVPDSKCLLLVFCFDYINSNFLLIDYGLVTKAVYHSVKEYVSRGGVSRFADAYKAHDIDALARIMLSTSLMQGQDIHQIIPSANDGESYLTYLPRMIGQRAAKNYLEVGVNTGDMLARIGVDTAVGVDPDFKLNQNVTKMKRDLTLIQETSDVFFSNKARVSQLFPEGIDVSFLDGMHQFEFLLRDFINAEAMASKDGVVVLHDCLPTDENMIHRSQSEAVALTQAAGRNVGWWTGDVWKVVMIIKKARPDLHVQCLNCAPTGLVCLTNLDPRNRTLLEKYDEIVAEASAMPNDLTALADFYRDLEVLRC